eukprot:SAG31_NODE_17142_length_681_cov_4.447436_1_plen_118_part_10
MVSGLDLQSAVPSCPAHLRQWQAAKTAKAVETLKGQPNAGSEGTLEQAEPGSEQQYDLARGDLDGLDPTVAAFVLALRASTAEAERDAQRRRTAAVAMVAEDEMLQTQLAEEEAAGDV